MIATIVIRDETNCKIDGLSVQTRRTLSNKFKFEVPYARHLPSVKLGRWDGRIAFFQLSGATYVNLLPEIVDVLINEGYELELNDQREYNRSFEFTEVTEEFFEGVTWPQGHLHEGKPVLLRDYQIGIVNSLLNNPQALVSAPTGSGKTIITAALSKNIERYGRSIVVVPSKTLVQQTEADFVLCGLDVGVLYGDRKEYNKTHTICTWQSLNAIFKRTKANEAEVPLDEFLEGVTGVIVDECFDGDELVLTPTGYVTIKSLSAGDAVINFCESTGKFKEDYVVQLHTNLTISASEKMYELEFDNGSVIKVTGNHKFLTQRGWVRADELTGADEIVSKT